MSEAPAQYGRVTWFDEKKKFGLIKPDDGGKDVFVHVTALAWSGVQSLTQGQRVSFETRQRLDGRVTAMNIKIIDSGAV